MALSALSLCGSGVTALMEFSDRHRQRDSVLKKPPHRACSKYPHHKFDRAV
jgi:hypothetical protein